MLTLLIILSLVRIKLWMEKHCYKKEEEIGYESGGIFPPVKTFFKQIKQIWKKSN